MSRWRHLDEYALFALSAVLATIGFGWFDSPTNGYVPGPRDASTLRVVSWNVGGRGDSAGQPLSGAWIPHVAETLRQLDPDLVFLQEIQGRLQFLSLRKHLGEGWHGSVTPGGDRRVAVLFRKGRLRQWHLTMGGDRSAIVVEWEADGFPPLAAVGLHANAFSAKRRNREIGRAVEYLQTHTGPKAKLLAGDFNLDLDLDKRRDLFSNDDYLDVETYNFVTAKFFDVGVGTGSTAEPDRRLDYIFTNEEMAVDNAGPWKGQRIDAMDHDPVVADLRFIRR